MKILKKISVLIMTVCLCLGSFSMVAFAADGRISFTDPETAVGEMVEVKCVVRTEGETLGNMEVSLSYDTTYLRYDSGDNVSDDGNGTLKFTGTGSSTEGSFNVTFQALKEGSTQITVASEKVESSAGTTLSLDHGNSTVQIAEGDPSKITDTTSETSSTAAGDKQVEVDGATYTLTDTFADADIPSGYSRTTVSLDGEDRQMVTNEGNTVYLAYLKDADQVGEFFLYDSDDATFAPYEEVAISDQASIIILSETSEVNLPDTYVEAKLTLNGKEFPVWQDSDNVGYYVLYALNNNGEKGYYQYDSEENTYQRFQAPEGSQDEGKELPGFVKKLISLIESSYMLLFIFAAALALVALIIIIVLATKLRHRNLELDDLYDEYGIDLEDEAEEEPKKSKKKSAAVKGGPAVRKPAETAQIDLDEDDFDDFDEYDEEEFDDYGAADEDDLEDDFEFDNEEDVLIDDLDELLSEQPKKKRGHMEEDDTFKVDFIDLD